MTCMCGRAADVKYVVYQPFAHVYELCGACALTVLWNAPALAWLRREVVHEAELILEAV